MAIGKKIAGSSQAEDEIIRMVRVDTFSEYRGNRNIRLIEVSKGVRKRIVPIVGTCLIRDDLGIGDLHSSLNLLVPEIISQLSTIG